MWKNYPEKIATIVSGVAEGCKQSGCALIGGETAEHPGLMPEDEYDLAGFTVGVVDKKGYHYRRRRKSRGCADRYGKFRCTFQWIFSCAQDFPYGQRNLKYIYG